MQQTDAHVDLSTRSVIVISALDRIGGLHMVTALWYGFIKSRLLIISVSLGKDTVKGCRNNLKATSVCSLLRFS